MNNNRLEAFKSIENTYYSTIKHHYVFKAKVYTSMRLSISRALYATIEKR
jgi:hypothetical protein